MDEFGAGRFLFLGACVFLAGFVDSLAGGGGLITVPAYLAVGLNPALLLGTNKLSATIGAVVSMLRYVRSLKIDLRALWPVIAAAWVGALLGARLALHLSPDGVRWLVVAALPAVAFAVLSQKDFGQEDKSRDFSEAEKLRRSVLIAAPIGGYDGFFGPGTGTFFALAFTRFCRYDLLRATASAKVLNLVSNVSALAFFLWAGKVHIALGLSMGVMSLAGHWTGSHWGLKKGALIIRPMIVAVCAGLFFKILLDLLGESR